MNNLDVNLEKYAELAVKLGVNIQQGQDLLIRTTLSTAYFVRKVVKHAYKAGAKNVHVEWADDEVTRIGFEEATMEALAEFPQWRANGFAEMAEGGTAFLSIIAPNPDLLKEIDPERIALANRTRGTAMKKFSESIMSNKTSWSIVAIPSPEWAAKVFPELGEEERIEKLWQHIFMTTRIDQADPVQAWRDHLAKLHSKVEFLNGKRFKKLHYRAPGTDLTIELPEGHLWCAGSERTQAGVEFVANMPTEEVFTLPHREGVNGTVTSTKPLNYSGSVIEKLSLTFEKGRIVDYSAEVGYETLKKLIETDEGSHYLGEVALVPDDSPISNLNTTFVNTLFDENASNHLAIGAAYPICLAGGDALDEAQLLERGANQSITHVDFMIGSANMDIDGETAEGTLVPVFRDGNWA